MREIPATIQEKLDEKIGLLPLVVVHVEWPFGEEAWYSTEEFVSGEHEVLQYIQSVQDLDQAMRIDGGSSSAINITFLDYFGHFKRKFDKYDWFDRNIVVTVYLTFEGAENELIPIIQGAFRGQIRWNEEESTLNVDIDDTQEDDDELLFVPEKRNIPSTGLEVPTWTQLRTFANESPWPFIVGSVFRAPATRVVDPPKAVTSQTVFLDPGLSFDNWSFVSNGTTGWVDLPVRPIQPWPFPLGPDLDVNLVFREETYVSLKVTGHFTIIDGQFMFRFNTANMNPIWYTNVPVVPIDNGKFRIDIDTGTTPVPRLQHSYVQLNDSQNSILRVSHQTLNICHFSEEFNDSYSWILRASKAPPYKFISEIPINSEIHIMDWNYANAYVIGMDAIQVHNLYVPDGDGVIWIPPTMYEVYNTTGIDTNRLWLGHHPCTYVVLDEDLFLYHIEQVTQTEQDGVRDQILFDGTKISFVSVLNQIKPEYEYSVDGPEPDPEPPLAFAIYTQQDKHDILTDIVWQLGAVHRIRPNNQFDMKYLIMTGDKHPTRYIFNDSNVEVNSIVLSTTPIDDVRTNVDFVYESPDLMRSLWIENHKVNMDKYGDRRDEFEFWALRDLFTAVEVANFWLHRTESIWLTVSFNTFLDAIRLELWDYVELHLSPFVFYNIADGTPLQHHKDTVAESGMWNQKGWIRHIEYNIMQGFVNVELQLPIRIGEVIV